MPEQTFPSQYEAAEWTVHAECGKPEAVPMFPPDGNKDWIEAAKSQCRVCPVLLECLTAALERGEGHGIWGGMTPEERRAFRRRQQRAGRALLTFEIEDLAV